LITYFSVHSEIFSIFFTQTFVLTQIFLILKDMSELNKLKMLVVYTKFIYGKHKIEHKIEIEMQFFFKMKGFMEIEC
jgi:hypothetical protein